MALPRVEASPDIAQGVAVASPVSPHGTHVLRHAPNFNRIVDGLIQLVTDHSPLLGNIAYIKEWWEDPAIAGEFEEFPCLHIIPLYPESQKISKDQIYRTDPYIGDPLGLSMFPITVIAYYKFSDIRKPLREVRDYAWNFWDILLQDKQMYALPGGIQTTTLDVGWHITGTTYVIQYWTMRIKVTGIL